MTIPTGRARTSKAVALFLALIGSIFVSSADAASRQPAGQRAQLLRCLALDDEKRPDPRAERALCGTGSGRYRGIRCAVHGSARRRPVLGDPDPNRAAAADRRVRAICLGDLRLSVRQLFRPAARGHRRPALWRRRHRQDRDRRIRQRSGDHQLLDAPERRSVADLRCLPRRHDQPTGDAALGIPIDPATQGL